MNNIRGENSDACSRIVKKFEEHERGLNEVLKSLQQIVEERGQGKMYGDKIGKVEKLFLNVREEISNLISLICPSSSTSQEYFQGPPVIIRCKQWEDFKLQAANSGAVSFLYKAEERTFQVDALKGSRVYTFSGPIPGDVLLLRAWLAKELRVEELRVVEGVLGIG
ncbi:MAG: hypothetical protein ACPLW8_07100 [Candidatus Bathyarchaeales archaeon]